ncbi:poly (ADP-ribose) glycohydrolase family protein [Striga asiatica]|uniref:poly(ADP-ribose) glycohydrolase n=1 Tax=Striga asiatica TaxID=4170 RepID=A0A5A7QFY9_STRAF|nr:poly (ADP-ribose) glycohydrolase family protein [Striga asiatica]
MSNHYPIDAREDFRSILPFLPLTVRSSAISWPVPVVQILEALSRGPSHSHVDSGELLAVSINDLRKSLGLSPLHASRPSGFSLFFDDLMNKDEAEKWFGEVVPRLAGLLLRLPELLKSHYQNAAVFNGMETGLRLLEAQQPGVVILSQVGFVCGHDCLSQELIAALLACALFCLFPTAKRDEKNLQHINFDKLFGILYHCKGAAHENKIKCIVHYFERVCQNMPSGNVSFERKVLPLRRNNSSDIFYPEADLWSKSNNSLCRFEVNTSGLIEDQPYEALEVDFADQYIGGLVLKLGSLQEEIRFAINPELIAAMLFLPVMADNESIEIVGPERFSNYTGYDFSFRFAGPHEDTKGVDLIKRRRTRVIAIDALDGPGNSQYRPEGLLREVNKAFCGFIDRHSEGEVGVATGNWGCGVFGGDPQVKSVIQWLAASQARRPFVVYYTFGLGKLRRLEEVVQWVESRKWSVSEVWRKLVEYSGLRVRGEATVGFFDWLIPSSRDGKRAGQGGAGM